MKTRLVVPLVGLAISFALLTYAQQKDLADPQTTQKILALMKAVNETQNNDPAARVALYTRDAVFVTPEGPPSSVGKPFRNGLQTCTSGGTPKTASTRLTGMPLT
jgi:ketosteroid isomerase-like protein